MYKNYITPEDTLELYFSLSVPKNHEARFISMFVDSIPDDVVFPFQPSRLGRPGHHPRMLLKMLLFAYSRGVFSGRKIAQLNEESIPMQWLTQQEYVCYHSINDFRSDDAFGLVLKEVYVYFVRLLQSYNLLDKDALFIDGTKIEADAYKYSFVWRKAVERYDEQLNGKITELYDQLISSRVAIALAEEEQTTQYGLQAMADATQKAIEELEEELNASSDAKIVSDLKQEKRQLGTLKRTIDKDYLPRKERYTKSKETFDGRNSYSKTDNDATFMRMKEDPMQNRELKPGYNLQIATCNQFVIDYALFSNPTDTRTLIPFLSQIPFLDAFSTIVADAGYGSEENYQYVIDQLDKDALIPYSMYNKELSKKFKEDMTQREHWQYHEDLDVYVDHDGVQFSFDHYSERKDKNGFVRRFKVYTADKVQETPELDALAKTKSGHQRQIKVNGTWESYKSDVKDALHSEEGSQLYAQRKIEVEPIFGQMKRNFGVRRCHVRGKQAVSNDIGLLLLAMNLKKLRRIVLTKAEEGKESALLLIVLIVKIGDLSSSRLERSPFF